MTVVRKTPGDSFDKMVSRLLTQCKKENIINQVKAKDFYKSHREIKKGKKINNKKERGYRK